MGGGYCTTKFINFNGDIMETREIMDNLERDFKQESDELLEKEINQAEKVLPVTRSLSDMGTFYKEIVNKLLKVDKICYICKRKLSDTEKVDIVKVPDNKISPGLIGYISVCKDCNRGD